MFTYFGPVTGRIALLVFGEWHCDLNRQGMGYFTTNGPWMKKTVNRGTASLMSPLDWFFFGGFLFLFFTTVDKTATVHGHDSLVSVIMRLAVVWVAEGLERYGVLTTAASHPLKVAKLPGKFVPEASPVSRFELPRSPLMPLMSVRSTAICPSLPYYLLYGSTAISPRLP